MMNWNARATFFLFCFTLVAAILVSDVHAQVRFEPEHSAANDGKTESGGAEEEPKWVFSNSSAFAKLPPRTDEIKRFYAWAQALDFEGIVEVRPTSTRKLFPLAVYASTHFYPGEEVICLPEARAVGLQHVNRSDMAQVLKAAKVLAKRGITAMHIKSLFVTRLALDHWEHERAQTQHKQWSDMFDLSIGRGIALPLWPERARAALQRIPVAQRDWEGEYKLVEKEVLQRFPDVFGKPVRPTYSFANFTTTYAALTSRAFVTRNVTADARTGMLWDLEVITPFIDLVPENTSSPHMIFHNTTSNKICVIAGDEIPLGSEITVSRYVGLGLLANIFGRFGSVQHVPERAVAMLLGLDTAWYREILVNTTFEHFFEEEDGQHMARIGYFFPGKLIAHYRVTAFGEANQESLTEIVLMGVIHSSFCVEETYVPGSCGVDDANEARAREMLRLRLDGAIASFPTTIEQDAVELAKLGKTAEARNTPEYNAIDYRLKLKEMLVWNRDNLRLPFKSDPPKQKQEEEEEASEKIDL